MKYFKFFSFVGSTPFNKLSFVHADTIYFIVVIGVHQEFIARFQQFFPKLGVLYEFNGQCVLNFNYWNKVRMHLKNVWSVHHLPIFYFIIGYQIIQQSFGSDFHISSIGNASHLVGATRSTQHIQFACLVIVLHTRVDVAVNRHRCLFTRHWQIITGMINTL